MPVAISSPAPIRADELYRLDQLRSRLGIALWSWRYRWAPRLRLVKIGRRKYCRGSEVLRVMAELEAEQNGTLDK